MTQANHHDVMTLLARHRLRVTRPRLEVLQVFATHDHLTGEAVYRVLAREGSGISMATIYRVLAELAGARILDRYTLGRGPSIFALHRAGHPVQLICRRCRRVDDCVDVHVTAAVAMTASSRGFLPMDAHVVVHGVCAGCAARPDGTASTSRRSRTRKGGERGTRRLA